MESADSGQEVSGVTSTHPSTERGNLVQQVVFSWKCLLCALAVPGERPSARRDSHGPASLCVKTPPPPHTLTSRELHSRATRAIARFP